MKKNTTKSLIIAAFILVALVAAKPAWVHLDFIRTSLVDNGELATCNASKEGMIRWVVAEDLFGDRWVGQCVCGGGDDWSLFEPKGAPVDLLECESE